jgi:tight adherence protein C
VIYRSATTNDINRRLEVYVVDKPEQKAAWRSKANYQRMEISGSLLRRLFNPMIKKIARVFGKLTPRGSLDLISRQLVIAGNPMNLGAREFYGLRLVFTLLGLWIAYSLIRANTTTTYIIVGIMTFLMVSYIPKAWLKRRMRSRQDKIRKGLPDALDMLSVCAEAGLGFDQSIQRVSEYWKTPLGIEFGRCIAEMEMGSTRAEAMRGMTERLSVEELSTFVTVILQSESLGMSIAETLHTQAKQMRVERRFRAQEQARKIPLKMLFPMLLLIFPAILVVIIGPTIPGFIDFFANMRMR